MKNNLEACEFISFAEEFILQIKGKIGYVRSIHNMMFRLKRFETQRGAPLLTNSFNEEVVSEFIHLLKTDPPIYHRKHGLRASTINLYLRRLWYLLKKADRAGCPVFPLSWQKLREDPPEPVYLTISELKRIQALELSPARAAIRDVFLVGAFTGLRYSDFSRLAPFNFVGSEIYIRTKKTGEKVIIPMHPIVRAVLERYHNCLPSLKTQQNFNVVIKKICREAGINTLVAQEYAAGTEVVKKTLEKWQLISTHTARRSFATNAYLAGIPVFRIMLITGHKTESAFFRYIRIRKEENARELALHPFFAQTT